MSALGFGFMRLPIIGVDRSCIDFNLLCKMVDTFMINGFCYYDTAYQYHNGKSEEAIRKAVVKRYARDEFMLADKMPMLIVKKQEDLENIFATQLERCGVTYFDTYLLHAIGAGNYSIAEKVRAFDFLVEKKQKGIVRKIGISFHGRAQLLEEILSKHDELDIIQLQINYVDWKDASIEAEKCYKVARKYKKEIVVMEPLKGGVLMDLPERVVDKMKRRKPTKSTASWALRFVGSLEGVKTILSGMSTFAQIEENIATMKDFEPLTKEEVEMLEQAREEIVKSYPIPCTGCNYCMDNCQKKINIPKLFAVYNNLAKFGKSQKFITAMYYNSISYATQECIHCGICERCCPQHIKITEEMETASHELKKVAISSAKSVYKRLREER